MPSASGAGARGCRRVARVVEEAAELADVEGVGGGWSVRGEGEEHPDHLARRIDHGAARVALADLGGQDEDFTAGHVAVVDVAPEGDLVIGDRSGVAVINADEAERVIGRAEQIAELERQMAAAIDRGDPAAVAMGRSYEEMLTEGNDE